MVVGLGQQKYAENEGFGCLIFRSMGTVEGISPLTIGY